MLEPQKRVTFEDENNIVFKETEPAKWVAGILAYGMDCVWKWAGARYGLQHIEEYGAGFEGWYWRSSVVSSSLAAVRH